MSLDFNFTHTIGGIAIAFHGSVQSADDALTTIRTITGATQPAQAAEPKPAPQKNEKPAATGKAAQAGSDTPSPAAQTPTASDSSANSSTDTNAADAAPTGESTIALDYEKHVKPLVLAISKKSRDWATALLQRHGAVKDDQASAKLLKPEQYPQFVKDAQDVLDGKLDPTQATEEAIA